KTEDKSLIYVGSYDNFLYCLDAKTGEKVWAIETNNYINGTPAVADRKVVCGGCDSVLYMADALTGESRGEIAVDAYIANSVAVDEGVIYTAHYGNEAAAYKISDQSLVWRHHDRDFPYFASPAVTKDRVYVAGRGKRLYA